MAVLYYVLTFAIAVTIYSTLILYSTTELSGENDGDLCSVMGIGELIVMTVLCIAYYLRCTYTKGSLYCIVLLCCDSKYIRQGGQGKSNVICNACSVKSTHERYFNAPEMIQGI